MRVFILALTLFISASPLWNAGFVLLDDPAYVIDNSMVRNGLTLTAVVDAFTSSEANLWHPLTWLSHMADITFFGMSAPGHHMVNLLLHGASALLLYHFLKRATEMPGPSFAVAVLFAIHPVHVESFAWVSERKDCLSGLFWHATLVAYFYHRRNSTTGSYLLVTALIAGALLSKASTVTLPLVLILVDIWPLRRIDPPSHSGSGRLLYEKVPWLLLAFVIGLVAVVMQQKGEHGAAQGEAPVIERIVAVFPIYITYLRMAVWPVNLCPDYVAPEIGGFAFGAAALAMLSLLVGAIVSARSRPWLFVGLLWFVVTLLPVVGLIDLGSVYVADRYMYLPLTGLSIAVAFEIHQWIVDSPRLKTVATLATIVILAALTCLTHLQTRYWQDSETLFTHTLSVEPHSFHGLNNLGIVRLENNEVDEAHALFSKLVGLYPKSHIAHLNLGRTEAAAGELEAAELSMAAAVDLRPTFVPALLDLSLVLVRLNRSEEALKILKDFQRKQPNNDRVAERIRALQINSSDRTIDPP